MVEMFEKNNGEKKEELILHRGEVYEAHDLSEDQILEIIEDDIEDYNMEDEGNYAIYRGPLESYNLLNVLKDDYEFSADFVLQMDAMCEIYPGIACGLLKFMKFDELLKEAKEKTNYNEDIELINEAYYTFNELDLLDDETEEVIFSSYSKTREKLIDEIDKLLEERKNTKEGQSKRSR